MFVGHCRPPRSAPWWAVTLLTAFATLAPAAEKKEFRYTVGPGASISVINEFGPITLRPSAGRQVIIHATLASNKVEIDNSQTGNRIELRSHSLQRVDANQGRVDFEVQVPADANVTLRSSSGPLRAERLHGELTLEGDGAQVEVRDISNGSVRVRTMNGPITLTNVAASRVEVTTVGGNVTLNNVSGPRVSVNATSGALRYAGDFGAAGDYSLTNHSGDIEVTLPASASVDITARSVSGSVENDFPLQPKAHTAFAPTPGKSFSGTANAGNSAVRLRTFTGKIRVRKQ